VVVTRDSNILLGLRRGSHGEGTWAFPGGKMGFGETIEECAARELLEETGLRASGSPQIMGVTNDIFAKEGLHYVTVFVAAADVDGDAVVCEPDKCERWAWFPYDRLPSPLFGPTAQLVANGALAAFLLGPAAGMATLGAQLPMTAAR
jgi:8-oxo-dGTP diphosphatase